MDPKYIVGIPEIDAQHEEITELVKSLQEVIADKDQWSLIHPTLKRLHHLLVTHFAYEESFMAMINSADLPQHRKMHKGMLKLFGDYTVHPPAPGDYEYLGKLVREKVLGHVMEHDVSMAESVRRYLGGYTTPALNVPGKK